MEMPPDNYETALDAAEKGIVAIPCFEETKVPCVRWKPWQNRMPPRETLRVWFQGTRNNVAIITRGMVVFDIDDPSKLDLVLDECGSTPHMLKTPRGGIHLGYRKRLGTVLTNQVKVKGLAIDIRTDGGIEVIHGRTKDGAYEWLGEGLCAISELPLAKIGWTRQRTKRHVQTIIEESCEANALLRRGRKYIDTFDKRAVSGCNGHTTAFIAALKIVKFVRKLGGGEPEAWQLLLYYNATKCDPPWDLSIPAELKALHHKLGDALRLSK